MKQYPVLIYCKECLKLAAPSAWFSAMNVWGTLVGTIIYRLYMYNVINSFVQFYFLEQWKRELCSVIICVIIAFLTFLTLKIIFVAPYKLFLLANSGINALSSGNVDIIIGTGGAFEKFRNMGIYYSERIISISVKNGTQRFVSNCNFYINIQGNYGKYKEHLLCGGFTLNPTEERYIAIAFYAEAIPPHNVKSDNIKLCVMHGTFYNTDADLSAQNTYILLLRVTSKEQPPIELNCKLWVDDGKLRLEAM